MQIPEKLMRYLNDKNVTYEILRHPEAFTAQTIAAAEHIKGRHHARVVMVTSGGEHLMTVLPADRKVGILRFAMALDRGANLRMAGQLPSPRSGLRDQSTHERGLDQNRHDPPYGAKARLRILRQALSFAQLNNADYAKTRENQCIGLRLRHRGHVDYGDGRRREGLSLRVKVNRDLVWGKTKDNWRR